MSTCPVDYVTSIPTEKVQYSMNLESVWSESLQHYGIKRNVPFTNRSCSSMNVKKKSLTRNVQFCLCTVAAVIAR